MKIVTYKGFLFIKKLKFIIYKKIEILKKCKKSVLKSKKRKNFSNFLKFDLSSGSF